MSKLIRIFSFSVAVFLIQTQFVSACTVNIEPLRKTFRQAKNVFVGEIISSESVNENDFPETLREYKYLEKLTFKVEQSWKGNKKQVIVYSLPFCDCPMRQYDFSVGKRFLVFTEKNSNFDVCNLPNIQLDSDKNNNSKLIIKRLNKFWFRTRARIYPF